VNASIRLLVLDLYVAATVTVLQLALTDIEVIYYYQRPFYVIVVVMN